METLDNVEIDHDVNSTDFRFPVHWVCRPRTRATGSFFLIDEAIQNTVAVRIIA